VCKFVEHAEHSAINCILSIDATHSSGFGRMVNDSSRGNCLMKKIFVCGEEHLCLFASETINPGDQLLYNYGDDPSRLFWRNQASFIYCTAKFLCLHSSTVLYSD
jgi:SET domain-containing protein